MPYGNDEVGVVRTERAMVWSIAFMTSLLARSHVQAQQNNKAKGGLYLAKFACAKYHSVEKRLRRSARCRRATLRRHRKFTRHDGNGDICALQTTPHRAGRLKRVVRSCASSGTKACANTTLRPEIAELNDDLRCCICGRRRTLEAATAAKQEGHKDKQ